MGFGIRLRGLWKMRWWVLACATLAAVAAVWSVAKIGYAANGGVTLTPRALQMASGSTQIVVDTPRSTLVDARQDTYSLDALTNRAVLVGNVMASPPVRAAIAQRARVPADLLQITPPLTPKQPRVLAEDGHERHTSDILKLSDEYRLFISANPTVPVLRIYAQAPDARAAGALANAAVDAMRDHLSELGKASGTPGSEEIRLMQLGRAHGEVINKGIEPQVAILAFLLTFGISCASVIFLRRVREGWRLAALADKAAAEG
jgi:hypothetical protein